MGIFRKKRGFGGHVIEAGGGEVRLLLDRDTEQYPNIGEHIWCKVDETDDAWPGITKRS